MPTVSWEGGIIYKAKVIPDLVRLNYHKDLKDWNLHIKLYFYMHKGGCSLVWKFVHLVS